MNMVQFQFSDIKTRKRRKAVYTLIHNKPSALFSLSRRGIFEVGQDYTYARDGITLMGEKALEAVREDANTTLEAFGYKKKDDPIKRSGYSLTCNRDVVEYLKTVIQLNRWILPS